MTESISVRLEMIPTFLDLFCGAGGLTSGLRRAGLCLLLGVESDIQAASTYAMNHGAGHTMHSDVFEAATSGRLPFADVIVAGAPSTGLVRMGRESKGTDRTAYWTALAELLGASRPTVFVLENVRGFLTKGPISEFLRQSDGGSLSGYHLETFTASAEAFGVPQHRTRTYLIGSLAGRIPWRFEGSPTSAFTVRDAISDIPWSVKGIDLPRRFATPLGVKVPGAFSGLELHLGRRVKPETLRRYSAIPTGGSRADLPPGLLLDCWKRRPDGSFLDGYHDHMGRMWWDRPSPTIRPDFIKPEKGRFLHPQWDAVDPTQRVDRTITHLEASRLQTFSDDYLWCGSKTSIARQIGNATPPNVALSLGHALMQGLIGAGGLPYQERLPDA